jgi:hypothetical protein
MSDNTLSPARIVCAAIRIVYTDDTGHQKARIIASPRHHDQISNPLIGVFIDNEDIEPKLIESKQGFVDQHCRFYTRKEAWVIAKANDQIRRRVGGDEDEKGVGTLFSENLY